jgi:gluconokinase
VTDRQKRRIVIMGVSAVGKSTVGAALAHELGIPFLDADDLHSKASVTKMASGTALNDTDRAPWLQACGRALANQPGGAVIACSALARRYREVLVRECADAFFVHLSASIDGVARRAESRVDHFMPAELLRSQFATLEDLEPDENGVVVDAGASLPTVLSEILEKVDRPD